MVSYLLLGLWKGNYIIKKSENLSSRLVFLEESLLLKSLKMQSSDQNLLEDNDFNCLSQI